MGQVILMCSQRGNDGVGLRGKRPAVDGVKGRYAGGVNECVERVATAVQDDQPFESMEVFQTNLCDGTNHIVVAFLREAGGGMNPLCIVKFVQLPLDCRGRHVDVTGSVTLADRTPPPKHPIELSNTSDIPVVERLVEFFAFKKHKFHISHLADIPVTDRFVEFVAICKHFLHIPDLADIPAIERLIEFFTTKKHTIHIRDVAHIPVIERSVEHVTISKHF